MNSPLEAFALPGGALHSFSPTGTCGSFVDSRGVVHLGATSEMALPSLVSPADHKGGALSSVGEASWPLTPGGCFAAQGGGGDGDGDGDGNGGLRLRLGVGYLGLSLEDARGIAPLGMRRLLDSTGSWHLCEILAQWASPESGLEALLESGPTWWSPWAISLLALKASLVFVAKLALWAAGAAP